MVVQLTACSQKDSRTSWPFVVKFPTETTNFGPKKERNDFLNFILPLLLYCNCREARPLSLFLTAVIPAQALASQHHSADLVLKVQVEGSVNFRYSGLWASNF